MRIWPTFCGGYLGRESVQAIGPRASVFRSVCVYSLRIRMLRL